MALPIPKRGIVFSPVGCGDSTTIVIDKDTVLQVDLHHAKDAERDQPHPRDTSWPQVRTTPTTTATPSASRRPSGILKEGERADATATGP